MECPKCKSGMETGVLNDVQVERCLQCLGIWFNGEDHKKIKKWKGSEQIDIGPTELGKAYDDTAYVPCPFCGEAMQRIHDKGQSHIGYEACGHGHGVFFDAGEFRDYKEKSLSDLLKKIVTHLG